MSRRLRDPDPDCALLSDRTIPIAMPAKEALIKDMNRWSHRFLLPIVRLLARSVLVLVLLVRHVMPRRFCAERQLHDLIYWGLRTFATPEANTLILRHFIIGSEILAFIADNLNVEIENVPLRPVSLEQLRPDAFLQHDLNLYNFILQINEALDERDREFGVGDVLDFSAISDEIELAPLPRRWHNVIDVETAIEAYVPLYALLLSRRDFDRAARSLQLDETVAMLVAGLLGNADHLALVKNRHPLLPESPLAAGKRLMYHGYDAEALHGLLRQLKARARD
jgi:hypothetical protein